LCARSKARAGDTRYMCRRCHLWHWCLFEWGQRRLSIRDEEREIRITITKRSTASGNARIDKSAKVSHCVTLVEARDEAEGRVSEVVMTLGAAEVKE
jgi:hypothetical protein